MTVSDGQEDGVLGSIEALPLHGTEMLATTSACNPCLRVRFTNDECVSFFLIPIKLVSCLGLTKVKFKTAASLTASLVWLITM